MPEALRPARARVAQAALADEDEKRCACPGVTCVFMNDGREAAGSPSFRFGPLPPGGAIFPEICGPGIWISPVDCLYLPRDLRTIVPWSCQAGMAENPVTSCSFFLTNSEDEDEALSRCQEHYNTVPTTVYYCSYNSIILFSPLFRKGGRTLKWSESCPILRKEKRKSTGNGIPNP